MNKDFMAARDEACSNRVYSPKIHGEPATADLNFVQGANWAYEYLHKDELAKESMTTLKQVEKQLTYMRVENALLKQKADKLEKKYIDLINLLAHVEINLYHLDSGLFQIDQIIKDRLFQPLTDFEKKKALTKKEAELCKIT